MLRLIVVVLLLCGGLAGCASLPNTETISSTTDVYSEPEPTLSPIPPTVQASPSLNVSHWDMCTGLFSALSYPRGTGPASPPPNWTGNPDLGQDVSQLALDCQRVGWGPFERPARMVWEVHNNAPAPTACAQGNYSRFFIVTRVFLDDPELAAFLSTTYGLPIHLSTIWHNVTTENNQQHDVWTWIPTGYQASWMDNWRFNSSEFDTNDVYRNRYAWDHGSGIALMDENTRREWGANSIVTPGQMNPPMLNANTNGLPYAGRGTLWDNLEGEFTFKKFGDYACEKPLP
jgi:hypothetical protein